MKADLLDFESEQNATDEAQAYRQKALELYGDRSDKQVAILLSEMAMYEAWKTDPDYEEATRLYEVMLSKTGGPSSARNRYLRGSRWQVPARSC